MTPKGPDPVMSQQEQDFKKSLEAAQAWILAVQERLKVNDITQGPREALEARLRETEKIHQMQHEGQLKMDIMLVAAEKLLQSGDEELKNFVTTKVKELKSLWDETCTYIVHCHSRIEWVWLHWSEYLKAYEEFQLWLEKQRCVLHVDLEHQLDLKEKLWQVDQQQVVLSDIHSQGALLERLLDEAAALHSRIQDPSVDLQAQQKLQEDYRDVRDRAKDRLALLQKISDDHKIFDSNVKEFQSWLLSKTRELTELAGQIGTIQNRLQALKILDDSVACEEKTLLHIEALVDCVQANTSPAGAEAVQEQAEELRLGWQRLRQALCEAQDGLHCRLDSHSQYLTRCQKLGEDIGGLRELLQGLDQELDENQEPETSEEKMVGQWRKYSEVRRTLVGEDSQVDLLKSQLKELFRFSEDSRHLSDDVLAVVKEHQSVKCRANRLCSESELELRSLLQDPLIVFSRWRTSVAQVMEASSQVTDFSNSAMLLQTIQGLLKDSVQLQERLGLLQDKGDLLDSVFGPEKSDGLQEQLSAAIRTREQLHSQLLQRKSQLQVLISKTKDADETYQLISSRLLEFREHLKVADVLQPDILTKKSQLDQLLVLQKDLEDGEAQLTALETLVSCSPNSRTQYEKLCADWTELQRRVRVKVQEAQETVSDHQSFHGDLLNMQKWMMVMRQKLESFCSQSGGRTVLTRHPEAQRALEEFPEKELQLQQMEVQVQKVLSRTSSDGQVHIQRDMDGLNKTWDDLNDLSWNLHSLSLSTETDSGSAGQSDCPPLFSGPGSTGLEQDGSDGTDWLRVRPAGGVEPGAFCREGNSRGTSCTRFKAWLSRENQMLSAVKTNEAELGPEEVRTKQETLQALRSRLPEGQEMFKMMLLENQNDEGEDEVVEDLRYSWMLYKSKLKENSCIRTKNITRSKKPTGTQKEATPRAKTQKNPGLLQRICRLALLLWLLLLSLLLLAFLLPLMDEGNSCSLSNNFARSFSVMLRYDGPPPT
ncbi:nesprin-3 isoform X3 [Nothobranchius furzeri]|uniref:Spectrin repeat containing, nuclear envelope family member 3 n=1 Tax=Nothobranchius furzeri TaxID=105023 RepID=A0A1A8AFI6_NOTFU